MPEYIRNPLCQRPASATSSGDWIDEQATLILELKAKLEAAAGREHKANNETTRYQSAVQLIALLLGLDADAPPPEVVAEARKRLR